MLVHLCIFNAEGQLNYDLNTSVMKIEISNNFAYYGFASIIFDHTGILSWQQTNLGYDNLASVFNHITGGTGTRLQRPDGPFMYQWDAILKNASQYQANGDKNDNDFGTYRGNPNQDEWAEFHAAPIITITEA